MTPDVAIVGGGVIGWSTAWHLLRSDPQLKVVVVDPHPELRSSLRGTGGIRAQFGSGPNIQMSLCSIRALENFAEEVGHDIGFRQHGYLFFTCDKERAIALESLVEFQRSYGVPVELLSGGEVRSRLPMLRLDSVKVGAFCGIDGYFEGPEVVRGYERAAREMGAQSLNAEATSIGADRVDTSSDEIRGGKVVCCTGHWSARFGLPVAPEKHQLVQASASVPPTTPMAVDLDSGFHFRPKDGGILIGGPSESLQHILPAEAPLYEPEAVLPLQAAADRLWPELGDLRRFPGRAGFYATTPDHHAIIGTRVGVVIGTGFGGHGVMHSPAAGLALSELVLCGQSRSLDVSALSPDRFERGDLVREQMVI